MHWEPSVMLSHTRLLTPQSCAIDSIEFRRAARRSRFRPPINVVRQDVIPAAFSRLSPSPLPQNSAMARPVCAQAKEEVPPREDMAKCSDEEDPFAPPDEVAPEPPTEDWFWGQYNLALWKALSPAERARQVAFKKERAQECARDLATWNALSAASKKEELKLWRWSRR